jgi:hypothetical protein
MLDSEKGEQHEVVAALPLAGRFAPYIGQGSCRRLEAARPENAQNAWHDELHHIVGKIGRRR